MDLSGAKIRYLLVIYQLSREKGAARSVDIAIKLGVARPSVHRMLSSMVKMGLIYMEPRGAASLTEDGLKEALEYERQYETLYPFFSSFIGLSDYDSELSTIAALSSLPSVCIEALCKKVASN